MYPKINDFYLIQNYSHNYNTKIRQENKTKKTPGQILIQQQIPKLKNIKLF